LIRIAISRSGKGQQMADFVEKLGADRGLHGLMV